MFCVQTSRFLSPVFVLVLTGLLLGCGPAFAVFGDGNETARDLPLLEIDIEGNETTHRDLILRELDLQIGQPFNREIMNQVWIHLEDIGYFAFVDMEFDDSEGDGVVLRIYLEEDLTTAYGPLVRYSRRHKYMLGGWLEETNLRGRGETLRLDLSVLYLQRGEVSWKHPWTFGVRGLDLELSASGENSNFVFRPTKQRLGRGDVGLRWNFYGDFFVAAGLGYGQQKYLDDYSWPESTDGDPAFYPAGTVGQMDYRGSVGFDSRDNPWYPSGGVFAEFGVRRWDSSDFDSYTETSGDVRLFIPSPIASHVLALHAWGRQLSSSSHLDNTLFFGGPETIRGYRFGGLEGDEGYLLSAEYRMPLFMMPISPKGEMVGLGLHVFGDAGDAWYNTSEAGRALQSWGGGAHVNIDRMQLRFEAARTREGEWVFEFMDHFNF